MTIETSHESLSERIIGEEVIAREIPLSPASIENHSGSTDSALEGESENSSGSDIVASDIAGGDVVARLWEECSAQLKGSLDAHVFGAYISPLVMDITRSTACELVLLAPNSFLRQYVDRYLRDQIEDTFAAAVTRMFGENIENKPRLTLAINEGEKRVSGSPYVVVKKIISPRSAKDSSSETSITSSENRSEALKPLSIGLNPRYTFSNFVVGNSNQFCHAAALRVAENPGASYNPLFVYGGVGLGKTHLLHAIGNLYLDRNPNGRVVYMSSETFTNELIMALRYAKMEEFKNRMRNIEVLLIDDIQFMRGKERTQEEFFHTFNALYNAKHQIVITSDKMPSEIPGLEERLQTRFSWGLTADIQAPDFETRVAILKRKATLDHFDLPEDVAHLVAENISSNVRELEGALTRLNAMSSLRNIPLSIELAEATLKPLLQPRNVNFSIEDIKKAVALHFGIKTSEMISKRRTKNLSLPRHVAMYLCRKHTTASYPEIGSEFGGRDHSSVIHAANVVATKIKKDVELAKAVESIERKLLGGQ